MSENDPRPDGHQTPPPGHPSGAPRPAGPELSLRPPPRRQRNRLGILLSTTAIVAAIAGGAGGAAIVSMESRNPLTAPTTATASTVSGIADVSTVAAKVLPSVVQVNVTLPGGEGIGSGVILTADGQILTNAHVVEGATTVTVTLSDGRKYQARVIGADPTADIAVLQAQNAGGLTPATLGDSSRLRVGEAVVAVGSPGGLQNTVTSGIVSALDRNLADLGGGRSSPQDGTGTTPGTTPSYTAIQTDAAIDQGNSGGALVDLSGQVIGINSALYNPSGSTGSAGIGFAIPINDAETIVNQITGQ
ncbi:MAG TPA: trypsin-like peptidase domain-containing protein [Amycolatopsis sp.]|jgi:putative serine protease PepD|nr:trypsin-like peptidase domain-containing protein [Amycolatopsis sp.]